MLTNNITSKLIQEVEKNLPAMVGKELQQVLEHYEKLVADNELLSDENKMLMDKATELAEENESLQKKYNAILLKETEYRVRLEDVEKREREARIKELEHEVKCADKVNDQIFRLSETVFKNPRIVTRRSESTSVPLVDTNGYVQHHHSSVDKTETTEVE